MAAVHGSLVSCCLLTPLTAALTAAALRCIGLPLLLCARYLRRGMSLAGKTSKPSVPLLLKSLQASQRPHLQGLHR